VPDPALAEALKEAYAAAPSDTVIYHTITLDHSTFATPLYLVRDRVDLTATLETGATVTFVGYAFDFKKPEVSIGGFPQLVVEIDNVNQAILAAVQAASAATDPVTLTYREYLSTDLAAPANDPPMELTLSNVKANVFRVSATATFGDYVNKRFPTQTYDADRFPGLIQ
jgi:hypothetical protein